MVFLLNQKIKKTKTNTINTNKDANLLFLIKKLKYFLIIVKKKVFFTGTEKFLNS